MTRNESSDISLILPIFFAEAIQKFLFLQQSYQIEGGKPDKEKQIGRKTVGE
jgi:hypothetical protein